MELTQVKEGRRTCKPLKVSLILRFFCICEYYASLSALSSMSLSLCVYESLSFSLPLSPSLSLSLSLFYPFLSPSFLSFDDRAARSSV
jgi:hypothetical protein